MERSLRLIANPHFIAKDPLNILTQNKETFTDKLHNLLISEYPEIYIHPKISVKFQKYIHNEINNMMIQRIIEDLLEECINKTVLENKFDFYIPFD